jgi:class 3 adenylate cyclase
MDSLTTQPILLNSKELLEQTGISRATLNNYISCGIVPRPQVLPPGPQDGAAPRIGYFSDDIVERIAEIQRLKKAGWDMKRISQHFGGGGDDTEAGQPTASDSPVSTGAASIARAPAMLTHSAPSPEPADASGSKDGARSRPVLTPVAVLVSDLQDSARVWAELPPEEYFELINRIWAVAEPIFRRHHGVEGKHAADGLVCHFLPQPDSSHLWNVLAAAVEMKEAMRGVSKEWQLRKGWATELYVNTGVNEGQEWLGSLRPAGPRQFTALGKTINQAARISEFARRGAVWATKNLVAKLTSPERKRLKFGIRRKSQDDHEVFVSSVFAKLDGLADLTGPGGEKFKDVGRLPITEIVDVAVHDSKGL